MASWLVCLPPYEVFCFQAAAGDIVMCSWVGHLTLTVPLPTQVCKWVVGNFMLGVTQRWTSIPSRFHGTEPGDTCWTDKPLGSKADFTYLGELILHSSYLSFDVVDPSLLKM